MNIFNSKIFNPRPPLKRDRREGKGRGGERKGGEGEGEGLLYGCWGMNAPALLYD